MASQKLNYGNKPPPPPNLSKETLIVWESWSKMGDREVARESAAKGLHIKHALTFLSHRRATSMEETDEWFKSEIINWALDLLANKQVFRASHILTNIQLDPITEITNTFVTTTNTVFRDFLGTHLEKIAKMDNDLKQSWEILKLIEQQHDELSDFFEDSPITIKYINDMNLETKSKLAAKLYLISKDSLLLPLLSAKPLWEAAITMEETTFITNWIKVQYDDETDADPEVKAVLQTLTIHCELLGYLTDDINENIKSSVYDVLAKYGVFSEDEGNDLKKLLSRLSKIKHLHLIDDVLSKESATVDKMKLQSLIYEYCIEHKLFTVLDVCSHNEFSGDCKEVQIINSCSKFAKDVNNKEILTENLIFNMQQLEIEPKLAAIVSFFILLTNNADLCKALTDANDILNNLQFVNRLYNKLTTNSFNTGISVYDLIEKQIGLKVRDIFPYRFDDQCKLPHFNSTDLVEKYGYNKNINYTFYLLQCRPCTAYTMIDKDNLKGTETKVNTLVLRNYMRKDIVSSCVAFLEMLGINSEGIRIEVKAADLISKSKLLEEDDLLKTLHATDKNKALNLFEKIVCDNYKFEDNKDIIDAIKMWDIVVKYAQNHHLNFPELLLQKFAENSLWLPFLITLQRGAYRQEQAIKLVQHFKNEKLLEHLHHCLLHDIQYEHKNVLMRERDSRNYFLSRIGVRKTKDADPMSTSVTSQSSVSSTTSSSGMSDFFDVETLDLKMDLLQMLIKCHNSSDPPKALLHACMHYKYPLFAVLATSYEPDSKIANWITWLAVMCKIEGTVNCEAIATTGSNVANFMKTILQQGYYRTLQQSFHIFLSDNPLLHFMDALTECVSLNFNLATLTEKLKHFHKLIRFKRSNSYITELDHDMVFLNNKAWIEETALLLLGGVLQHNFITLYNKIQFLEILSQADLKNYFITSLPDFAKLLEILRYLFEKEIELEFNFFKLCNINLHMEEITSVIKSLIDKNMFEEALKVATTVNIPPDSILIEKWKFAYTNQTIDWHSCNKEFKTYKIVPRNAVLFFTDCTSSDKYEKYKLLKLAYDWAFKHKLEELQDLERDMWRAFLRLETCEAEAESDNSLHLYFEMKTELSKYDSSGIELSEIEKSRLGDLIDHLLSAGDIFQAFKLEKLFEYSNTNLEVLKLCFNLAEGLILPFQLNTRERLLIKKSNNFRSLSHRRKTFRSPRLSSISSVSRSPGNLSVVTVVELETVVQDTLALIESLVEGLTSGEEIGQNIFMSYRISLNADKKYGDILKCDDPEDLLLEILAGDCRNKLEVVYDFISIFKWPKQKIADFLCEQIINSVMQSTQINENISLLWDLNLDKDMHLILQLLQDSCSMLGNKLYNYASALHKVQTVSNEFPYVNEIVHIVELLIRAHDCFTTDCNMEGISVILKKCQTLINLLLTMKNWKLIVRLLTGVARYNELNYVFHILRENDQFEYLLRHGKSNTKDNSLKIALLEYLKKYCPDNRKLYEMVALHFSLFSEVAVLWENESKSILRNLIAISKLEMQNRKIEPDACLFVELTNTDGTRICLNKAMENFTYASEYHLQGEKLAKAMNAARQAELIALQLSLLKGLPNTGTCLCILNLNALQITSAILSNLSFQQALILTEAYEHQTDWAAVLFEQYITNNQVGYLANYLTVFPITDNLVHDISRRFISANVTTISSINNMKGILKMLPSVHVKYRIASELGFPDLVEELLNSDKLMYLKDTVWKRGYKG